MMNPTIIPMFAALTAASFVPSMGGGGPLEVVKWKGDVQIRPLSKGSFYQVSLDAPEVRLANGWQGIRRGTYVGSFEMRAGRSSWLQFNGACLDAGSRVRIEAMADLCLVLRKGCVSLRDGKRGPSLIKPGHSAFW